MQNNSRTRLVLPNTSPEQNTNKFFSDSRTRRTTSFALLKNKGQMEIMGLAVIVVLVVLGLLFALLWMVPEMPKAPVKARESVLAANFLNTLLGTTTECEERTVRDLLQDCALTGGIMLCERKTSCEKSKEIIQKILDSTLEVWGKDYYFTISGSPDVKKITFEELCPGEREQKVHPVPVRPGFDITLLLQICE